MTPTQILFRYLARQYALWFCLFLLLFGLIIFLIDSVELFRRVGDKPNVTVPIVLEMSLNKLPLVGFQMFPFAALFSAMFTLWRLTRSNELVVARAVGVSAWQFLAPLLAVAALAGVIRVAVFDPIGALMVTRYNDLETVYVQRRSRAVELLESGLWLRQVGDGHEYLIHAAAMDARNVALQDVVILRFNGPDNYDIRIDADRAVLTGRHWDVRNGVIRVRNRAPQRLVSYRIPTELTRAKIEESFAPPETISFWGLAGFVETLEATGLAAVRHRLHYQSLLAQPLFYCAMVLIAAAFSLRLTRRGGTLATLSAGLVAGFTVFILTDVSLSLGESETLPVFLAAWAPATISLMIGSSALLFLEDG